MLTAETEGEETSMTLSANCARASKDLSPDEAKTMRTWPGRCCKNNSRKKELSGLGPAASPRSCYIRQSNCVGFLSPSSSAVKSCCSRRCSEAAVRLMS